MIADLAIAPVKGMRLCPSAELELTPSGPRGDRAFLVVDTDRELLLSQRNPDLLRVRPCWEPDRELLTLRFPDGTVVSGTPEPGADARTAMYDGRPVPGSFVDGPFAEALSSFLRRRVHLLRRAPGVVGADDHPVSLMSNGSLAALAPARGTRRCCTRWPRCATGC